MTRVSMFATRINNQCERDPGYELFGADNHRYEVEPSVPLALIESWEQSHSIALPGSYRQYIAEVGAGGAGPGYGLLSFPPELAETDDRLARRFDLEDAVWSEDEWPAVNGGYETIPLGGTLRLADYGNGITAHLVVRGVTKGDVWIHHLDSDAIVPFAMFERWHFQRWERCLHGPSPIAAGGMQFSRWFDDWLIQQEAVAIVQ